MTFSSQGVSLFLCGDVMTGRGIDQVLAHSVDPQLYEPFVKAIEVYRGAPIFYGCGDFLNDYEGIGGHESYRDDLPLMYFVTLDHTGRCSELRMTPLRIRRFRLERAPAQDARWLRDTLDRECRPFGARVTLDDSGRLALT